MTVARRRPLPPTPLAQEKVEEPLAQACLHVQPLPLGVAQLIVEHLEGELPAGLPSPLAVVLVTGRQRRPDSLGESATFACARLLRQEPPGLAVHAVGGARAQPPPWADEATSR